MHLLALLAPCLLVAVSLMGYGMERALTQASAIGEYREVEGTILSSQLTSKGLSIQYSYVSNQQKFENHRITPLPGLLGQPSRESLEKLQTRYRTDALALVWVNPMKPASSFLVKQPMFWPYAVVLIATALLAGCGLVVYFGGAMESKPASVSRTHHGWHNLAHSPTVSTRAQCLALGAGLWWILGLGGIGHYTFAAGGSVIIAGIAGAIWLIVGLIPVMRAWGLWKSVQSLGTPRVLALQPGAALDQPVVVKIELPIHASLKLKQARASLACFQYNSLTCLNFFRSSQPLSEEATLTSGNMISGECAFEVPVKKRRSSSPYSRWQYPRTDWVIEVVTQTQQGSTAITRFPIDVVTESPEQEDAK